jgi:hypothetical protein
MKNKDKIKLLLREGLSIKTVANLNEAQLDVLTKKFKKGKKEETKETTMVSKTDTATQQKLQSEKKPYEVYENGEMSEDVEVDKDDASAGEYTQDMPQKPAPDGGDDDLDNPNEKNVVGITETNLNEKFESQAQQNFFWGKCNTTRGVQKQKWCQLAREFSDKTTKKDYEKMPEKLHPEKTVKYKKKKTNENLEKFLEKKIVSILENKVKPKMKKSDLVKLVKEKSESMILQNPKKVTMFSDEAPKPIRPKKK